MLKREGTAWVHQGGVLLLLAGCDAGPQYMPVTGRVTFDGVPIESGVVQFVPADGKSPSAKGGIIKNGEYAAEVAPGEMIVRIVGHKVVSKRKIYDTPDSPIMEKTDQFVPKKYNSETILKATITAGKDDLDFKLTSD